MDVTRREFLHSAGATAMLATIDAGALAAPSPAKPIGWAKWTANGDWFPVYEHYRNSWHLRNSIPYAVVACYADA